MFFIFQKSINSFFIIIIILVFIIHITSASFSNTSTIPIEYLDKDSVFHYNSNSLYSWPLFGYYTISSGFGHRTSPTTGASSYHSGIDIPANENTNIYAICDGIVTFTGFYGADGYSIIIENKSYELTIIYGHVSPNFIVSKNQSILKNQKIGFVGPKYVDSLENTKYFDNTGKKTNGATTRMPSTFNNKKRRHSRRSFRLFVITYRLQILPNLVRLSYHILDIQFHD